MPEFQHHSNWLRAIEDRIADGRPLDEKERTDAIGTCEWVLGQNPASEMAAGILQRVRGVMTTAPAVRTETLPPGRADTTDLVTGKNIVNIRMMAGVSQRQGDYVHQGLTAAFNQSRAGGLWNIKPMVEACNAGGPFPGFLDLLNDEQRARLHRADADLCEFCFRHFSRLCLAHETEGIITAADAGIDRHIVPLIGKTYSAETRGSIQDAIAIWKKNLGNPSRNTYYKTDRFARTPDEQIGREYAMPLYFTDPAYFSVGLLDGDIAGDNVGAGYDAPMRLLLLRRPGPRGYTFLQALNALHETTHTKQHNEFIAEHGRGDRQRMIASHDAYIAPLLASDNVGHGIIEEEAEAFANMIELVFARTGFGTLNIGQMLKTLGMNENDQASGEELMTIANLAQSYYAGGGRQNGKFPPAFMRAIEDLYTRTGMKVLWQKDILPPA